MPDGFLTALGAVVSVLFLLGAVYIYLALVRQIAARSLDDAAPPERTFGLPDAILAIALATFFGLNAAASATQEKNMVLRTNDLIFNGLLSAAIFVFIVAFLSIRRRDVNSLGGFSRLSFGRVFGTSTILLFAAYPLISIADLVSRSILGGGTSRQGIVEMFNNSPGLQERALIIVLAIAIAPLVEEFVFRFFLYGVMRQYLGRLAGMVGNALLFSAVHAHLPSAGPLFVLGCCFTLAYEWSGSILVPMAMHALFNSFTLVALAFPEWLPVD